MSLKRRVAQAFPSRATVEGAGVRLHRAFGYNEIPLFDPFLMLDDFRADREEDYRAGFPWHPHRGIETVTWMLEGRVDHGDSMGHAGSVGGGDVQWMTAGAGIIHQEMPRGVDGRMGGFQLWVNLPRRFKMIDPRYQEIPAGEIPVVRLPGGATARVICGSAGGVSGPVHEIMAGPEFLDVSLEPGGTFVHPVGAGFMAASYVIGGSGRFDPRTSEEPENRTMVLFGSVGDEVEVRGGRDGTRFLFLSGRPLREPIAWGGPIVMNTDAEVRQAFSEYRNGTFLKRQARSGREPGPAGREE